MRKHLPLSPRFDFAHRRQSSARHVSPQAVLSPYVRVRRGLSYAPVIAYLTGFLILLLVINHYFLTPAYIAAKDAPPDGLRKLKAVGMIMLMVTLVYLLIGLILTFRIGRFFFPRPGNPRVRTPHVDIWAEAGKRMDEKPPEGESD